LTAETGPAKYFEVLRVEEPASKYLSRMKQIYMTYANKRECSLKWCFFYFYCALFSPLTATIVLYLPSCLSV